MIIFYQSNSSLNMVMADTKNFPEARVMAVIFGFPSFLFNELSWNPSSGLMLRYSSLGSRSFKGKFVLSADFFFCVLSDHRTALVSCVLGVIFSNRCFVFFPGF